MGETMDVFEWVKKELAPEQRTTEALIYEHMASQSGRSLPIVYQPFDPGARAHWRDRGAALDFVLATRSRDGRVLDFGPGDGWPSLIAAPFVAEVVGVEGSPRRVAVCEANAARLGLTNTTFRYVEPGAPLPFEDGSFDAVVAASSLEQSPDPKATLTEFYRVLRPSGRLRIHYEALNRYRGDQERELWLWATGDETRLILYDRHIEEEYVEQVGLTLDLSEAEVAERLCGGEGSPTFDDVTIDKLAALRDAVTDAGLCTTYHPSGATLSAWMTEVGFRQVFPTHDGMRMAGELFDHVPADERPSDLDAIDAYLAPIVEVTVDLLAPLAYDPMITAVK